ncbi:hypothetical protein ARMGADRAFT_118281 [Armillaria gallica]|uniref:C3H1-type domain-containing protein n=1 Tax=Armillaria gallica TaxID=47427 RepID=A0A2H3CCU0_ARMGA|nr:hypothetical protein ARMGADRAFT_118281 [Armillaria gallica]
MRIFWSNKDLINNYTPGSDAPHLASSSTREEWAAEGHELFNAKHFSQAKHCFDKAKLPFQASIANAYDLRAKARTVIGTSRQNVLERRSCFAKAAVSFEECAQASKPHSKDSRTYLRICGECFEQADQKYRAAEMFLRAKEYTHAAELYRDIGKFDEAVKIVKDHEDEMSPIIVENVIKLARLAYFSNHQMIKARKLFDSVEEEVGYLEERDLDLALADVLEEEGRFSEAAELHYSEGRKEQAIELFLRRTEDKAALRRAQECILEELWHRISFGVDPKVIRLDSTAMRLMRSASRLDATFTERTSKELSMFKAIIGAQTSRLRELGSEFCEMGHSSAAMLCLDRYFSQTLRIQDMALVDAVNELSLFYTYVDLLSAAAFRTDPCEDAPTAALFGFRRIAENEFLLPPNTWLHSADLELRPEGVVRTQDSDYNLRLSVLELRRLFCDALKGHLKQRIAAENDECARGKAFLPCLVFAVSGSCKRPECPEAHVLPSAIHSGYYNMRVRLHLQQILILQSLRENAHEDVERKGTKFWLHRLYEALHPPYPIFGSISHLALSTIPEAPKALNVVRDWVRTLVYGREYHPRTNFLMDVMRTATLAFTFDRSQSSYLRDAAYFRFPPPYIYIRRGSHLILHELLYSMSGARTWSLTAGFRFVEHVVKQRLSINIGVLCDFVDFLCSSVILCGDHPGTILPHDVIVPHSWLLRFVNYDFPHFNKGIQTNYYHILLAPIWDLLEQLRFGRDYAENLLYGISRNLSNVPYQVRHVFIARIFRAIGLLGCNIHNSSLRNDIRKRMLSFQQEGSPLFDRYVSAAGDSWDKLADIICGSLKNDNMDKMVQLFHRSRAPTKVCALPGVRQLVYTDFTDIRAQLGLTAPTSTQANSPYVKVPQRKEPDDEAKEVEETAGEDADAIPAQEMTTPDATEREIAAASLFQRVYRKVLRHRRGIARRGTAGLHAQIHAACLKEVSQLGDSPGLYLRLFLGPLPHILVCLETVRIDTLSQKKKTKDRLKQPCTPIEYGALGDMLTQTNKANMAAVKLKEHLSPHSAFHKRLDRKELRKLVKEANSLISSLPFETSMDLSDDLYLAIRGIVTEPPPVGTRKKPMLNNDDLYY